MEFKMPLKIVSKSDISKLLRELNSLNDYFSAVAARRPGTPTGVPLNTPVLAALAKDNGFNLIDANSRRELGSRLDYILQKAPNIHISFATEPNPRAVEQILNWFRANIHPLVLLQIGLQPSLIIGCSVRTPNKQFDLSLHVTLEQQQRLLASLVDEAIKNAP